jgi:hypothetical protein
MTKNDALGNCRPGEEHNLFTNECEPIASICPSSYSNTGSTGRLVFVDDPFLNFEDPCPPNTKIDPE